MSEGISTSDWTRRRTGLVGWRGTVIWVALLIVASLLLFWLYPRAFPFAPTGWTITRSEAIAIVEERLRDLGDPVKDPYITATLNADASLELRLRRLEGSEESGTVPLSSTRLSRRLNTWRVSVYERDSDSPRLVGEWSYLAVVSVEGQVLTLLRGTPPGLEAGEVLAFEEAVVQADRFLAQQGFDRDRFGPPSERRVDLPRNTYLFVRYPDLEAAAGEQLEYGVEVRFVGDRLQGFVSWYDDQQADELRSALRPTALVGTAHVFAIFLFLPFLVVIFVRRYHRGVVGVRRGLQVFALVFGCCVLVLLMTARAGAEGSSMGNTTRPQMTWLYATFMLLIYFPALATIAFIGSAVGESWSDGRWRSRLASFDALFRGQWGNSTVATSALRGVTSGVLLAVAVLLALLLLRPFGAESLFAFVLGPWWHSAALPGVALLLVFLSYAIVNTALGRLFLGPPLVDRFGPFVGGAIITLATGIAFFPPISVVPLPWGLPIWFLSAGVLFFLFYRYDLTTSLLASLVSKVALCAIPLIQAVDASLQLQGWIALLGSALPLWVSARFLGTGKEFRYRYDDVPPHVRMIAERERQRVELETARRIQSSILPELPPQLCGVELSYVYLPATEVGGDFYDVLALEDGRLSVAIGDVAGHGVSSGLIMSMARTALAVQVTHRPEVHEVFETLNRLVYQSAGHRLLTTLCYALLDPRQRTLTYASAGHLYPYRVARNGQIEALESTAYPLGVRSSLDIEVRTRQLDAGDALFLSSDGLVEARRLGGEELFGYERLEESLRRHAGKGAESLRLGVLEDVELFTASGSAVDPAHLQREDDLTVLVLKLPG